MRETDEDDERKLKSGKLDRLKESETLGPGLIALG